MTARAQTAVEWLRSIAPKLAEFRQQDAAEAALHSAHVEAWMDCPSCAYCGEPVPGLVKRGHCRICPACAIEHPEEEDA